MQATDSYFFNSFITLLEDISDAVCIASPDGKPVFINSSFKNLFGIQHIEELNSLGGLAGILTENVYIGSFNQISNNHTWEGDTYYTTKTKNRISVAVKVKPLVSAEGSVKGAALYFRDTALKKDSAGYLRLLESFVEHANDAVMITEAEPIEEPGPRIVYVNSAFTRITGYVKEEILGKSPRRLQGPATNRKELDKIRKALENKSKSTVEIINYTKEGKEFWIEFSVVPVPDENNRVTHFVSIQRETTHKRQTDKALLENNKELQRALKLNREIFEHSLDIICVFDQEGRFIHVSDATTRVWGYTPKELAGQSFTRFVYREDLAKSLAMAKRLKTECSIPNFENRYVHKDGRIVPMMWTASWSEDNQFIYAIGRDISERKKAEEKIQQSEQLYRTLSQNYPNGTISICDRDYRILVMEGQELARFNVTSDMLAGKYVHEIFGKRAAAYIKEKLSPTFGGQALLLEMPVNDRYYLCTTVPLPKDGKIDHMLVVTQDITARKKAEKQLEESYQAQQRLVSRMTAILDSLPAQVALADSEGRIIDVNEAWKNFASRNGLRHTNYGIGNSYSHACDASMAEGAADVSAGIREVISGNRKSFSMEYPCPTPTGIRWFQLVVSPMAQIYPTDVVVMHVDITDRKQIEQQLQEKQQRYKSLFEYHPDAVCALDLQGNFISLNPAMAKLAGAPAEELLNQSFIPLVSPQDLHQALYHFKKAAEGHPQDLEISFNMPGGDVMDAHLLNIPIIVHNKIIGVYSILKDITPTKRAQKLAEETVGRLNNILNSIGDGFFTLDKNFTVTYWNKAAETITGTKRENIVNKIIWDVFPATTSLKYYPEYIRAMHEQVPVHFEECYTPVNVWIEVNAYPSGEGLTVYFRDITERKTAEENLQNYNLQLQKINHELDQFVYRASHDLRAPLVSILGLINLSYMEQDEAQKSQYLTLMEKSVRKLDTFIQEIIYYSKNSRTELILSEIDFPSLISNTVDNLKFMEEAKSIEFRMDVEPVPQFYTDENRLNVILHNIVANAIRYHDPAKRQYIYIRVASGATTHTRITIEDNGQGISKEHQARVFDMFYRATDKNVGTGLGLYIVHENLKKLKGTIALESEAGQGTTFTLEIPNLAVPKGPGP